VAHVVQETLDGIVRHRSLRVPEPHLNLILVFRRLRSSASHPGTSCPAPSNRARTRRHRLKRIRCVRAIRKRSRSEPDPETARSAVHRHDRRHAQLHEFDGGAALYPPQVDSHGSRRRPAWHRHPKLRGDRVSDTGRATAGRDELLAGSRARVPQAARSPWSASG
jgi:hypothetical protein